MAFIVSALCFNLVSCGGDDDGKPNEEDDTSKGSESPEDNLPEASKTFVGLWENISYRSYYIFLEDGICRYIGHSVYQSNWEEGYWTFNPETSILATTMSIGGQWLVTISNNDSWAGTNGNSGKNTSYKKATHAEYLEEYLNNIYIKWKYETEKETANLKTCLNDIGKKLLLDITKDMHIDYSWINVTIEEDENINDYVYKYKIDGNYQTEWNGETTKLLLAQGKFTVTNPYHSTKCQLTFNGKITNTFVIHHEKK